MNTLQIQTPPLPKAFLQFSGRFYDGISDFTGSPKKAIEFALHPLSPQQRDELASFIHLTLTNGMSDRDLELVWLRSHCDMYPDQQMVRSFHEAILSVLEAVGR